MKTLLSTDGKITKISIEPETPFEKIIAAELDTFEGQKTEIIVSKDEDKTIYITLTNY
jgi:hypothetical protein